MNFNYGFIKKDPKQPVMAESLKHIRIQQPDIEAFIDNENDFLAITRARISAQVADISDKAIYQAIIDYATKAGLTDVYLIDEKFIRDAIVTKVTKDVEVEALRMKIENLEEELQSTYRDLENAEERDNAKALTIDELREELAHTKSCIVDMACGSNDLVTQYSEQLKTKNIENDKLRKEIDELEMRNAFLEGAHAGSRYLKKDHDFLKSRVKELEDICKMKNAVIDAHKKRIEESEKDNQRLRDANACACAELDNKIKQNEELFKENKAFESALTKAEGQRDFYMRRTSDYDRLKERIAKQNEQIDKYDLVIHTIEQLFGCAFDI